ncbi:NHS family xanthosine MFS transporter [Dysgonomonas sp. PFB1-18]|uniref:nucleoside permease n=1 Tax=unclassified Dysgonomonas TaxID=2630389 RepID=UPI0024763286|nr:MULTISPECIES: nucleoside permease [unclassified Dysgonomonas]MDH6309332.1 NHS family xanthosine MFS transporter [Dysgonomonas sp. PF1-14]MDH6339803.1 NHS family xanthosine MFS transporter [Dysgonomonas sp. PF1-16]MDH6381451.1 NHS family xanthosine MFS transporter [Dysgonomonas sp. PFB1-18]MDH6398666.1 NHS family xanthosine MFS transporter [Dysgonomonas sp. PF1-23]
MNSLKIRLIVMNFFQFFVWGAWMITIGNYWFSTKHWQSEDFGIIFSTMGIASIFMPTLCGIIADRWINTERLYGILHILCGLTFLSLPMVDNPTTFFWVILLAMIFYMPTLALSNSIAYSVLNSNNLDTVKHFPPIRVWGTVGFIAAMWLTNLTDNKASENQFYIAGITAIVLGLYAFSLPKSPPQNTASKGKSLTQLLGLDAFKLFKDYKMALFFLFSMLLGAALQLTNAYGDTFLDDFKYTYPDSFVVRYSTIILSISQVSETLFILAIPFFLRRFGIKTVMLISMLAWVLRFGLFAFGNPEGGLWMIILSCIVYGMAFDFFNISGSLFVEKSTDSKIRSSAQGLFMMMTNGFGAVLGSWTSGMLIGRFFTAADGMKDWQSIWLCFAAYALVVAVLFAIFFKYKYVPEEEK